MFREITSLEGHCIGANMQSGMKIKLHLRNIRVCEIYLTEFYLQGLHVWYYLIKMVLKYI